MHYKDYAEKNNKEEGKQEIVTTLADQLRKNKERKERGEGLKGREYAEATAGTTHAICLAGGFAAGIWLLIFWSSVDPKTIGYAAPGAAISLFIPILGATILAILVYAILSSLLMSLLDIEAILAIVGSIPSFLLAILGLGAGFGLTWSILATFLL